MGKFLNIAIFLLFFFAVDAYTWGAVKAATNGRPWVKNVYWGLHILFYISFAIFFICMAGRVQPSAGVLAYYSFILVFYIPKLIIIPVLLVEDVSRLARIAVRYFSKGDEHGNYDVSRARFLSQITLAVAAIPFAASLYGVIKGKYDYRIIRQKLILPNLPDAFVGMTIAQISDIHAGTFDNKSAVRGGVQMLMDQKPDMVFFTGDIVNAYADEMDGYFDVFDKITAPMGVYSILGNHDYADYPPGRPLSDKPAHREAMLNIHKRLGWNLLLNESRTIERNGQKIALIGVENWGTGGFSKYGDLSKAVEGTEGHPVKLLLSHDPSHWDAQVRKQQPDIDVMFSGHTHGFQLGIEIGHIKWSPSQWRYKQWGGLYKDGNQQLYVNRGFGFMGFSGRIGVPPEITIFELAKA